MIGSRDGLVAPRCKGFCESLNSKPMSLSFQNLARQRGMSALEAGSSIGGPANGWNRRNSVSRIEDRTSAFRPEPKFKASN
jgi:hypothetical protein